MLGSHVRLASLALLGLVALGCGGTGQSTTGGGSQFEPIAVTVSDEVIDYGDTFTVSWKGDNLRFMNTDRSNGTNFSVGRTQTSGSITDRPATDTTYLLKGLTKSDTYARATVRVKVRPSSKSFLIVGSKADPLIDPMVSELKGITTGAVTVGQKIPSTPVADVIVISDSASFDQTDEPRVRALLAQGGRLLLLKSTINKLAGAVNLGDKDLSSIRAWAGAERVYRDFGGYDVLNTLADVPLSLVHAGNNNGGGETAGTVVVMRLDPGVVPLWQDRVKRVAAFVHKPALGGRIAHMGGLSFGPSHVHEVLRGVFLAECRWLADYR